MFFNRKKRVNENQLEGSLNNSPAISTRSHSLIFAPEDEPLFDELDFVCFKNTEFNSKSEKLNQIKISKEKKKNFTRFVSFLESVEVIGYIVTDASEEEYFTETDDDAGKFNKMDSPQ